MMLVTEAESHQQQGDRRRNQLHQRLQHSGCLLLISPLIDQAFWLLKYGRVTRGEPRTKKTEVGLSDEKSAENSRQPDSQLAVSHQKSASAKQKAASQCPANQQQPINQKAASKEPFGKQNSASQQREKEKKTGKSHAQPDQSEHSHESVNVLPSKHTKAASSNTKEAIADNAVSAEKPCPSERLTPQAEASKVKNADTKRVQKHTSTPDEPTENLHLKKQAVSKHEKVEVSQTASKKTNSALSVSPTSSKQVPLSEEAGNPKAQTKITSKEKPSAKESTGVSGDTTKKTENKGQSAAATSSARRASDSSVEVSSHSHKVPQKETNSASKVTDKANKTTTKTERNAGSADKNSSVRDKYVAVPSSSAKDKNRGTGQSIAVVREKDEETRQAEREAARLAAQERQRLLHLSRSPTTLIAQEDKVSTKSRTSPGSPAPQRSRASSAKTSPQEGRASPTKRRTKPTSAKDKHLPSKHDTENLFDEDFDSKSFEERTAEMKNQVLGKLAREVYSTEKYKIANKCDKDNINKMKSGVARIAPEGRGTEHASDDKRFMCDPQVTYWLQQLNLKNTDKYVKLFAEHEIDMEGLKLITEDQLREIGIRAVGAYNKILVAIKELQESEEARQEESTAVSVQKTRTSVLRENMQEAKQTPGEVHRPWLNPNRIRSVKSKTDTGLARRLEGRVDSAPSSLPDRARVPHSLPNDKSRVAKASSLSRLHDTERPSARLEQAASLDHLDHPKLVDNSVSFLPRPVYQKQVSLDRISKHSSSSSSNEEAPVLTSRRQRHLLYHDDPPREAFVSITEPHARGGPMSMRGGPRVMRNGHMVMREGDMGMKDSPMDMREGHMGMREGMGIREGPLGMRVEIKKRTDAFHDPHVPQLPEAHQDEQMAAKKSVKPASAPRRSVALPVVQFGVNVGIEGDPEKTFDKPGGDKPAKPAKPRLQDTEKTTSRPTSRPQTQTMLRNIQEQLDAIQSSPLENSAARLMVEKLQSQLVDIQKQVLQTHQQQQRLGDARLPETPLQALTPETQDNLNLSRRSDSSSEASPGRSPRHGDLTRISAVLREDRTETRSAGKTRSNQSEQEKQDDMLRQVRKQKDEYRRKIKHLEAELNRLKHRDPIRHMEVNQDEIFFDETGLIGEGAFSQVFRGSFHGSEVAVKRLKVPLTAQDKNYFTAEVCLMQDLRHPRVVLLLGVCTTASLPLMILEYMPKGSLYHHLHDPDTPALDHVAYFAIARDIALGMNYLHQHRPSVLHLDLKSMNVLLTQHLTAKIADFGFSKLRYDSTAKSHKSSKHTIRGTPAWMAPELLQGGDMTVKADVYSFAIILWEMITRQHPYKGCSLFKVIEKVCSNKRPEIPAACPKPLALLMAKCWEHQPARRPTFKEILGLLEQMHFPAEWRLLFSAAGVPQAALEDIESTRTLIDIITDSLDQLETQGDADSGRGFSLSPPNYNPEGLGFTLTEDASYQRLEPSKPQLLSTGKLAQDVTAIEPSQRYLLKHMPNSPRTQRGSSQSLSVSGQQQSQNTNGNFSSLAQQDSYQSLALSGYQASQSDRAQSLALPGYKPQTDSDHFSMSIEAVRSANESVPPPPPLPPPLNPIAEHAEDIRSSDVITSQDLAKQKSSLKHVAPGSNPPTDNSSFLISSNDLMQQRRRLRQVKPLDINQFRSLSSVTEDKFSSMAEMLKKAMESRRIVLHGGEPSIDQSLSTIDWSTADL